MYCPNCGKQNASETMRFCSRCGFSLRGVLSARRNELIQGLLVIFIALLLLPSIQTGWLLPILQGFVAGLYGYPVRSYPEVAPDVPVTILSTLLFIVGVVRVLSSVFIESAARRKRRRETSPSHKSTARTQPPETGGQHTFPAGVQSRPAKTSKTLPKDLAEKDVVSDGTELTTKLIGTELNRDDKRGPNT
jgi:hypothetical protein